MKDRPTRFESAGNSRSLFAIVAVLLAAWWFGREPPAAPAPPSTSPPRPAAERMPPPAPQARHTETGPRGPVQAAEPEPPPPAPTDFVAVPGVYADAMDLDRAHDGSIWITSKYTVHRVPPGEPWRPELMMNGEIYQSVVGSESLRAFACAHAGADGRVWLGGWYGEVLGFEDGRWRRLSPHQEAPARRVHDLQTRGRDLWIAAADGLWISIDGEHPPQAVSGFARREVTALALGPAGRLFAARQGQLLRLDGDRWTSVWQADNRDDITWLGAHPEGVWAATRTGGLTLLDVDGRRLERRLIGHWVTGAAEDTDGALWVAGWKDGLLLGSDGGWRQYGENHGLPTDSISAVLLDEARIWLTLYGRGAVWAPLAVARERLARGQAITVNEIRRSR